jgi:error-prone DNA polymerase
MTDYVELRCRSAFTFLDGATLPEEIVAYAAELGYRALALADRDGLYGAPRFFHAARALAEEQDPKNSPTGVDRRDPQVLDEWVKRWPLKPILGAELSLAGGARLQVLVENREGYRNLSKLITASRDGHADRKVTPEIPLALVAEHARGLCALTGGSEGAIGRALDRGDEPGARRAAGELIDIFGARNLYAEVGRHFDADEEVRNVRLCALAGKLDLPLVATNDVRYARPESSRLYDVLVCGREKTTVDQIGRRLPRNSERYLKSPTEMAHLFRDLPGAVRRTREVAERCSFTLAQLGYRFPSYPLPDGISSMQELLTQLAWAGAQRRFLPLTDKHRRQIERELSLIGKLDLAGYFLIVWDLVEFCRGRGILVQGRGSAANSAVCYALGITAVDPIAMELLFERFLSEERGEWPDIDLDLPSGDQREEVIQYVYKKYGGRGAAMTANVITYRPKMAVRDAGRALGFTEEELSRMSKMLSGWGFHDPKETIQRQLGEAGFTIEDERTRLLVEMSNQLLNLPRHLGQHSGGMVIGEGRLDEVVPLEPASMPGRVVVQWDKDDCADLGIVKVDLLGLGMMAALEEAVELVRKHEQVEVDLAHLPPDDPAIYDMLQRADTVGLFQVESRAQMATLPRMKPKKFYDIVIEVAIIRPGPIVGDMLHPYLRRRAGREKPDPLHPCLKQVLDRTLGVPLFQEQLMRMAMIAANFTGGQAEELRRAMGFKRSMERMADIERSLRDGMAKNGITGEPADKIVKSITAFALYGFPESHAASFALIVYASAHLKVHHPAAFYASLLNCWPMGFYHPSSLVRDAMLREVEILPICATRSNWRCTLEENEGRAPSVRIGLRYVGGLAEATAKRLEAARAERELSSVEDLAARVSPSRAELTALAEVGALSSLGRTRRGTLWQVEAIGRSGALFSGIDGDHEPQLDEMSERETLAADYRVAGLSTGRHPMALRRIAFEKAGILSARDLEKAPHGRRVRVAGTVITRQRPGTAKGFFFLTLEDETGLANAIVNPAHFDAHRPLLVSAPALVVEGKLQKLEGTVSVKADRFWAIDEVAAPSHDFH